MNWAIAKRMSAVAGLVLLVDQITKMAVVQFIKLEAQVPVIDGFFKFVHLGNTGAAWSLFYGNNGLLAILSAIALIVLLIMHHRFDSHRPMGQLALGLILGGILGNLTDRLRFGHVVDFLYFYVDQRGGGELAFPAFNVADACICCGVALVFWLSRESEKRPLPPSRSSVATP